MRPSQLGELSRFLIARGELIRVLTADTSTSGPFLAPSTSRPSTIARGSTESRSPTPSLPPSPPPSLSPPTRQSQSKSSSSPPPSKRRFTPPSPALPHPSPPPPSSRPSFAGPSACSSRRRGFFTRLCGCTTTSGSTCSLVRSRTSRRNDRRRGA